MTQPDTLPDTAPANPLIGHRVLVRSSPSGCWFGTLAAMDADTVTLTDARRLWRWWAAHGVSLSGVAAAGLDPAHLHECRIAAPVATAIVLAVCEVLAASPAAAEQIAAIPVTRT